MSQPNIPDINPDIKITRDQSINLLLSSIAMEELGLAHIINAEGEKIQAAIGTLKNDCDDLIPSLASNIKDLEYIGQSVNKTLETIIKKEMLLQFKLENVLDLIKNKYNSNNDNNNNNNNDNNNECNSDVNLKQINHTPVVNTSVPTVNSENLSPQLPPDNNV